MSLTHAGLASSVAGRRGRRRGAIWALTALLLPACRAANPAYERLAVDGAPPSAEAGPGDARGAGQRDQGASDAPGSPWTSPGDDPDARADGRDAGAGDAAPEAPDAPNAPDVPPRAVDGAAACAPWGHGESRARLALTISAARPLPAGAWVGVRVDHAALVSAGAARADGQDVTVVHEGGGGATQRPIFLDPSSRWNAPDTLVWFRAGAAVEGGAPDSSHRLYVGGAAAPVATRAEPVAIWRRVQTGALRVRHGELRDTTIEAVDPSRSFVVFSSRHAAARPSGAVVRAELRDGRTLRFARSVDDPVPGEEPIDVRYQVVELAGAARVQRATTNQVSTSVTLQPLSSTERAFVLWSKTVSSGDAEWGNNDGIWLDLPSTTSLAIMAHSYGTHAVSHEVVELPSSADVTVLRGSASLQTGALSAEVQLPRRVEPGRSFALVGLRGPGGGGDIGNRLVRAEIVDANRLRITRGVASDPSAYVVGWQVVELGAGAQVASGTTNLAEGQASARITLPRPVETTRAFALASMQAGAGAAAGATSYVGNDVPGVCSATLTVEGATLAIERASTVGPCSLGWSVVEPPASGDAVAAAPEQRPACP